MADKKDTPRMGPIKWSTITVEELDACITIPLVGRVIGHLVNGRIVYDGQKTQDLRKGDGGPAVEASDVPV